MFQTMIGILRSDLGRWKLLRTPLFLQVSTDARQSFYYIYLRKRWGQDRTGSDGSFAPSSSCQLGEGSLSGHFNKQLRSRRFFIKPFSLFLFSFSFSFFRDKKKKKATIFYIYFFCSHPRILSEQRRYSLEVG